MADEKDIVKDVVEVLHDGHKGFSDLAEHIKDPQVKAFFLKESQNRAQYASELESAAGLKRDDGGTAAGAVHRFWGDMKGKMGGGDHTLPRDRRTGRGCREESLPGRLARSGYGTTGHSPDP